MLSTSKPLFFLVLVLVLIFPSVIWDVSVHSDSSIANLGDVYVSIYGNGLVQVSIDISLQSVTWASEFCSRLNARDAEFAVYYRKVFDSIYLWEGENNVVAAISLKPMENWNVAANLSMKELNGIESLSLVQTLPGPTDAAIYYLAGTGDLGLFTEGIMGRFQASLPNHNLTELIQPVKSIFEGSLTLGIYDTGDVLIRLAYYIDLFRESQSLYLLRVNELVPINALTDLWIDSLEISFKSVRNLKVENVRPTGFLTVDPNPLEKSEKGIDVSYVWKNVTRSAGVEIQFSAELGQYPYIYGVGYSIGAADKQTGEYVSWYIKLRNLGSYEAFNVTATEQISQALILGNAETESHLYVTRSKLVTKVYNIEINREAVSGLDGNQLRAYIPSLKPGEEFIVGPIGITSDRPIETALDSISVSYYDAKGQNTMTLEGHSISFSGGSAGNTDFLPFVVGGFVVISIVGLYVEVKKKRGKGNVSRRKSRTQRSRILEIS